MKKKQSLLQILRLARKLALKPVVISAGIPRTGSTLLFNIIREILKTKWGDQLSSAWVKEVLEMSKGEIYLIKMHQTPNFYRWRAKHVFFSYRDVRVAAVSAEKTFNRRISINSIRHSIIQYQQFKKRSDLMVKYEDLIVAPEEYVKKISKILNIEVDHEVIVKNTSSLEPPDIGKGYSPETLLHGDHFTNTKDDEWRKAIPHDLQLQISNEFSWWFKECGYPLS
jgi:hypothetical protein